MFVSPVHETARRASSSVSISEIDFALPFVGVNVSNSLPRLAVETAFFCLYSLIAIPSFISMIRTGIRSTSRRVIMLACIVMYLAAAIHYILSFHWLLVDNGRSSALRDQLHSCLQAMDPEATPTSPCALDFHGDWPAMGAANDAALSTLLMINIILSVAIVVWRVCMLWPKSRALKIIFSLLVLSIVAMLAVSTGLAPDGGGLPEVPLSSTTLLSVVGTEFADVFGSTAIAMLLFTAMLATCLFSVKAWRNRRDIRDDLREAKLRTRVEIAFILVIESGIIYCLFWTLLVAGFVEWDWPYQPPTQRYIDWIIALKASAMIDIVAMYSTLLIILGTFTNSYVERWHTNLKAVAVV